MDGDLAGDTVLLPLASGRVGGGHGGRRGIWPALAAAGVAAALAGTLAVVHGEEATRTNPALAAGFTATQAATAVRIAQLEAWSSGRAHPSTDERPAGLTDHDWPDYVDTVTASVLSYPDAEAYLNEEPTRVVVHGVTRSNDYDVILVRLTGDLASITTAPRVAPPVFLGRELDAVVGPDGVVSEGDIRATVTAAPPPGAWTIYVRRK